MIPKYRAPVSSVRPLTNYSIKATLLVCSALYLSHVCLAYSAPELLALAARTTYSSLPYICTSPPRGSCSFYQACLESRYHCGSSGYPLGLGRKYCLAFSANLDKFSPRGQEWVLDTMQCLQRALVPEAEGAPQAANIATCAELENYAFSTHPACYIDNGLCQLPVSDWEELVRIVGMKTAFGSWEAIKAEAKVGVGCGELYLFLLSQGL